MGLSRIFIVFLLVVLSFAIVDRTYYTYLGLEITATPEEIASAYAAKKEKIMGIEEEESKNSKLKILEEGNSLSDFSLRRTGQCLEKISL